MSSSCPSHILLAAEAPDAAALSIGPPVFVADVPRRSGVRTPRQATQVRPWRRANCGCHRTMR